MTTRRRAFLVLALVLAASPAFAQFPGEPKNPGVSFDPVAEQRYVFARGAPNETVLDAQRTLRSLGYYWGEMDGIMSPELKTALWNFQKANGLTPWMHLDRLTLTALGLTEMGAVYASPPTFGTEMPAMRTFDEMQAP